MLSGQAITHDFYQEQPTHKINNKHENKVQIKAGIWSKTHSRTLVQINTQIVDTPMCQLLQQ